MEAERRRKIERIAQLQAEIERLNLELTAPNVLHERDRQHQELRRLEFGHE
jgi:hypothetical protein